jgi:circadian clock protein KaiB
MSARLRLRLFVAGDEPRSREARENLARICRDHLKDRQPRLEVVDVLRDHRPALRDRVFVTPMLLAEAPGGPVRIAGTLSDRSRVVAALGLPASAA